MGLGKTELAQKEHSARLTHRYRHEVQQVAAESFVINQPQVSLR